MCQCFIFTLMTAQNRGIPYGLSCFPVGSAGIPIEYYCSHGSRGNSRRLTVALANVVTTCPGQWGSYRDALTKQAPVCHSPHAVGLLLNAVGNVYHVSYFRDEDFTADSLLRILRAFNVAAPKVYKNLPVVIRRTLIYLQSISTSLTLSFCFTK